MKTQRLLLTTIAAAGLVTAFALPADAATSARSAPHAVKAASGGCSLGHFAKYRKYLKTEKRWPNDAKHRVSGWGPHATLRLDKQVSVANKVSGTFGASYGSVSATVGFDVTKTWTTTISYSAELKKKAHYTLRAGEVYKVYAFNVYDRRGELHSTGPGNFYCAPTGKSTWVGTGKAKKFWTFDFKLTKA
ncbi:hypothetical protein NE235_03335 [Actinoallomurus spadix]|uniref:Uncharacterized protein n=1 Tax=Actinoallomurus spadix TaxID=79912 RepID=A0ABN0XLP2_9ACTN|nr:hypothetical protein [Actinoallomurus spadix]MCO5985138.1 hypothetical protein [Actinoallomurus spadix]